MTQVTVSDKQYSVAKLNAMDQWHVARRMLPVMDAMRMGTSALAYALSSMTDADSEYVIYKCLSVVKRREGDSWQAVYAPGGGIMFADIEAPQMLELTVEALKLSLANFSALLLDLDTRLAGKPTD